MQYQNSSKLLFSHSVTFDSLRLYGLQHAKLPCSSLSPSLLTLMSIESVMPSSHLNLCRPLLLLLSVFPSIRVFSNESALRIRWPKYWGFSFTSFFGVLQEMMGVDHETETCSFSKSCLTLFDPMDYSTSGFSVLHYLLEFAHVPVH